MNLADIIEFKSREFNNYKGKVYDLIQRINNLKYDGYMKDIIVLKKNVIRYEKCLSIVNKGSIKKIIMLEKIPPLYEEKYLKMLKIQRRRK